MKKKSTPARSPFRCSQTSLRQMFLPIIYRAYRFFTVELLPLQTLPATVAKTHILPVQRTVAPRTDRISAVGKNNNLGNLQGNPVSNSVATGKIFRFYRSFEKHLSFLPLYFLPYALFCQYFISGFRPITMRCTS